VDSGTFDQPKQAAPAAREDASWTYVVLRALAILLLWITLDWLARRYVLNPLFRPDLVPGAVDKNAMTQMCPSGTPECIAEAKEILRRLD